MVEGKMHDRSTWEEQTDVYQNKVCSGREGSE